MDPLHIIGAVFSLVAVAVGATWALRTKLSDIEVALRGHVEQDEERHGNHEGRIVKLEKRHGRR